MKISAVTTVPLNHLCGHHSELTVETSEYEAGEAGTLQSVAGEHPCLDCLADALRRIHPALDWTPTPVARATPIGITGPLDGEAWRLEAVHALTEILSSPWLAALLPTTTRVNPLESTRSWFTLLSKTLAITDADLWCDISVTGWAMWFGIFELHLKAQHDPAYGFIRAPLSPKNHFARDWRQWVSRPERNRRPEPEAAEP